MRRCIQEKVQPSSIEEGHRSCQTCLDDNHCHTSCTDMKRDLDKSLRQHRRHAWPHLHGLSGAHLIAAPAWACQGPSHCRACMGLPRPMSVPHLHGLAKAHLIADEGAPAVAQRKAHALALKSHQPPLQARRDAPIPL